MRNLIVAIPTFNEEIHIERSIKSAKKISSNVYIFDSGSTDKTKEIALQNKIKIISLPRHLTFSEKMNFIYKFPSFKNSLILRHDADEIISEKSIKIIKKIINSTSFNHYTLKRKLSFLQSELNFGKTKLKTLRIALCGSIFYEDVYLDERIYPINPEAKIFNINAVIIDNPLFSYNQWIIKHLKYSDLEASMIFKTKNINILQKPIHVKIYYFLPPVFRTIIFFIIKYIFYLGFLDGIKGLLFHISHSLIYRLIVDIKIIILNLSSKKDISNN